MPRARSQYTQGKPRKGLQIHCSYHGLCGGHGWLLGSCPSSRAGTTHSGRARKCAWEWLYGLAVTDGVDCWCALSDLFRRWDWSHRLVPRHVRLCNRGWDHGAGWFISAGVLSSAGSLLGGKAAVSKQGASTPTISPRLPNRLLVFNGGATQTHLRVTMAIVHGSVL